MINCNHDCRNNYVRGKHSFMAKHIRVLVILSLLLTAVSLILTGYSIYKTRRLASATRPRARLVAVDVVHNLVAAVAH